MHCRYVQEATQRLPVIGDADTGYGNAVNVKRTMRGFAAAGFAGILIEDQVCWHAWQLTPTHSAYCGALCVSSKQLQEHSHVKATFAAYDR